MRSLIFGSILSVYIGLILSLAITFTGCTAPPTNQGDSPQGLVSAPLTKLAWEKYPENAPWSTELRKQITLQLPQFLKAKDWGSYCPKFSSLDQAHQVEVIATMAVWISYYECSWDATSDAPDVGDTNSVGLYQLSYIDNFKWCSMSAAKNNLTDPFVNIQCAIPEMANLISRDGVVTYGGSKEFSAHTEKGLARYWSTLWNAGFGAHKTEIMSKVSELSFCN